MELSLSCCNICSFTEVTRRPAAFTGATVQVLIDNNNKTLHCLKKTWMNLLTPFSCCSHSLWRKLKSHSDKQSAKQLYKIINTNAPHRHPKTARERNAREQNWTRGWDILEIRAQFEMKRSAWDEMEAEIAEPWPTGSSSRLWIAKREKRRGGERAKQKPLFWKLCAKCF